MRTCVLIGLMGWGAVIFQSSLLSALVPGPYTPDLLFILVLYAAISLPLWTGIFSTFLCGYFIGIFSGGPVSLWVLVYSVSFFLARPVSRWFSPDSRVLHAVYPFVFTFIKSLLLLGGFWAFSKETGPLSWVVRGALGEAVLNSLVAYLVFPVLKYCERTRHASFEW